MKLEETIAQPLLRTHCLRDGLRLKGATCVHAEMT